MTQEDKEDTHRKHPAQEDDSPRDLTPAFGVTSHETYVGSFEVSAGSGRVTVSPSGEASYQSIQRAVDETPPETRITVLPGRYEESLVLDKPVEIVGEGPVEDIVVSAPGVSHCIHMNTHHALVRGLTLEGSAEADASDAHTVCVEQGHFMLENCRVTAAQAAGLALTSARSRPAVEGCTFEGGEVGVMADDGAKGELGRCTFTGQKLAGVLLSKESGPVFRHCEVLEAEGSGVVMFGRVQARFEDCRIEGCGGTSVEVNDGSTPAFVRCTVAGGQHLGVHVCRKAGGLFEECTISGHGKAAFAASESAAPVLRRCLISDGKASGLFVFAKAKVRAEECRFVGNRLEGARVAEDSEAHFTACSFQGGRSRGVSVYRGARAWLERCTVTGNAKTGVYVAEAQAQLMGCRVNGNHGEGIRLCESAKAVVRGCDLTQNDRGAIEMEPGVEAEASDNVE